VIVTAPDGLPEDESFTVGHGEAFSLRGAERYTMAEAARIKGVSYHTVSRAVRQGRLPVFRLGRMALISGDDLENWQPMRERAPRRYRTEPGDIDPAGPAMLDHALGERLAIARHLSTLFEVIHAASSELSMEAFGQVLAQQFHSIFGLRRVSVWLTNLTEHTGQRLATAGEALTPIEGTIDISSGYEKFFSFIEMGQARVSYDPVVEFGEGDTAASQFPTGPLLIVPLRVRDRTVGSIFGDCAGEALRLDREQLSLAQVLGNQAALALDNALLRAQEQLRIAQLSAIIDQMDEQVRACDVRGRLNLINMAAKLPARDGTGALPELGSNAMNNPNVVERRELDGTLIPLDQHPLARALRGEEVSDWEYDVLLVDGVKTRVMVSARPLVIDGAVTGAVYLGRNVDALREAERQHAEALEVAERARRRAQALADMAIGFASTNACSGVARLALDALRAGFHADKGMVCFVDAEGGLTPSITSGFGDAPCLPDLTDPISIPITILALSRKSPAVVERAEAGKAEQQLLDMAGVRTMVVVPVHLGEEHIAALSLFIVDDEVVDNDAIAWAGVVGQHMAVAIGRARGRTSATMS